MGVPYFLKFVKEKYPLSFNTLDYIFNPNFETLFIDFTQIIYQNLHYFNNFQTIHSKEVGIKIFRYIDLLVYLIKPSKILYIAFDGVPPYAKLIQFRQHRINKFIKGTLESHKLDIYPGSRIVRKILKQLKEFIIMKAKTDPLWKSFEIIIDSYNIRGEAEHKIFDYFSNFMKTPNFSPNSHHCFFSRDSDMIFLLLSTHYENICILQDNNFDPKSPESSVPSDFQFLYIKILREYILMDFFSRIGINSEKIINNEKNTHIIDDFIGLLLLYGNDYIPKFPEIEQSVDSINTFLQVYSDVLLKNHINLLQGINYNLLALSKLIKELLIFFPNSKISSLTDQKQIIYDVLNNLHWTLSYTFGQCRSWSYCFKYQECPSLSYLNLYVSEFKVTYKEDDLSISPYEAMLIILPHKDSPKIIKPESIKELYIKKYFPTTIEEYQKDIMYPPLKEIQDYFKTLKLNKKDLIKNNIELNPKIYKDSKFIELNSDFKFNSNDTNYNNFFFPTFFPDITPNDYLNYKYNDRSLNLSIKKFDLPNNYNDLIGKIVLVNYPYFIPAKIESFNINNKNLKNGLNNIKTSNKDILISVKLLINLSSFDKKNLFTNKFKNYFPYSSIFPLGNIHLNDYYYENIPLDPQKDQIGLIIENNECIKFGNILDITSNEISINLLDYQGIHSLSKHQISFDKKSILEIEKNIIQKIRTKYNNPIIQSSIIEKISKNNVIWENKSYDYHKTSIKNGDLIITIFKSGIIPFGTVGIVIDKDKKLNLYKIITLIELEYGITFNNLLQTKSGIIIKKINFIKFKK